MRRIRRVLLHVIAASAPLLLSAACAGAQAPQQDGYVARQVYLLEPPYDRMRGRIELLEDARIREGMRKAISEAYGDDPCVGRHDPALNPLCTAPNHAALRHAMLRLVGANGDVVAARLLERPLAELSVAGLYAGRRRAYMLTVDLSAGAGSYSGPYTRFAEPDLHGFEWVTVDSAGVTDTLTMVSTMKTAWRAVRPSLEQNAELLMVRCRPDVAVPRDSAAFTLTFERFAFDGTRWHLYARSEPGCYESDEPFPPRSKFP